MFRYTFILLFSPLLMLAQSHSLSHANTEKVIVFLKSLSDDQKKITLFPLNELNRFDWHFVPPTQSPRTGISIKSLQPTQKEFVSKMLQDFLSEKGYEKTKRIMGLEYILMVLEPKNSSRISENYFISIYGMPGIDAAWGWKFTGHHLALNFTVVGNQMAVAPFFFGANPGTVGEGPQKGFRALKAEEDLGFELINLLNDPQREKTIFNSKAFSDIVTFNSPHVMPLDEVGLLAKEMTTLQKVVLEKLIATYLADMPEKIAKQRQKKIIKEDFDDIRFGWAGATVIGQGHYYRVQGKSFLIEFDNTQNNANHIHAVWRDFNGGDYGLDMIKTHYEQHSHKDK